MWWGRFVVSHLNLFSLFLIYLPTFPPYHRDANVQTAMDPSRGAASRKRWSDRLEPASIPSNDNVKLYLFLRTIWPVMMTIKYNKLAMKRPMSYRGKQLESL